MVDAHEATSIMVEHAGALQPMAVQVQPSMAVQPAWSLGHIGGMQLPGGGGGGVM